MRGILVILDSRVFWSFIEEKVLVNLELVLLSILRGIVSFTKTRAN